MLSSWTPELTPLEAPGNSRTDPSCHTGGRNASAAKAGELGAKTFVPPTDIPDVGRFAVFADPTGAALAIIQLSGTHQVK